MADFISDFAEDLRKRRINTPESFTDDILNKIALQKEGGFHSMKTFSRVIVLTVMLMVYCSLGVILGIQGYRNFAPDEESSPDHALFELMDSYHLNPGDMHDQLFINFSLSK